METNSLSLINLREEAEQVNYTAMLNSYLREFSNWSRYLGIPKYDEALAAHFRSTGYDLHIRIDFSSIGLEVYAPLSYYSESGRHIFHFPVVKRDLQTDEITELAPTDLIALIVQYAQEQYPEIEAGITQDRLQNSVENLEKYLENFIKHGLNANAVEMDFIRAEQSLILGHSVHPVPKSKQGFNDDDLFKYSPETAGRFQLHYFLIDAENVIEKTADDILPSVQLKKELLALAANDVRVMELLNTHPTFTVVPMHPWEANYLLQQDEVLALQQDGKLFSLGDWGAEFTPTSSVRTVYNEGCDWMFKFSLHVKITNSERINLYPELHRGYDISRLLKTPWGQNLQKDFPEIDFIVDPAFIAVTDNKGQVINGFNISIRRNPFKNEAQHKNVTLLAALCQDSILGEPSRLTNIIKTAAQKSNKVVNRVAEDWFKQYLHICIRPMVSILNKYGLACEFHQQNVMVELDKNLFPAKLYFRDNQGFFFRTGKADDILAAIPGIADESKSIIDEEYIAPKYTYYLMMNNLLGVVNAFGVNGLADEKRLLDIVYKELKSLEALDKTGLVSYIINSRDWSVKGNLLTSLHNMNEANVSLEYPAVYVDHPNPLNKFFFCKNLIKPERKDIVYTRYFPKEDVTLSIRPFDIDRDLEMVHDWFNQEQAKPVWKMDGPIRGLELFYRTIIPSDATHSFIGEVNGIPNFTFEPYWPARDLVGAYYECLPTDYGTHLLVAPAEKEKKFAYQSLQVALDYLFAQPEVGKCIGEAAVESRAMRALANRIGYQQQRVIDMPHKSANLTFLYREWYWEKNPGTKEIWTAGQ